jgi:hypothetical protein
MGVRVPPFAPGIAGKGPSHLQPIDKRSDGKPVNLDGPAETVWHEMRPSRFTPVQRVLVSTARVS